MRPPCCSSHMGHYSFLQLRRRTDVVGDIRKRYQVHVAQPSTVFGGRPSLDLRSSALFLGLAALHMGRLADSPVWCPLLSLFSS